VGVLRVDEIYELDRALEAREVYETSDAKHPGVAYLHQHADEVAIGGRITLARRTAARPFPPHHRDPREVRDLIAARGWRRTVAFHTDRPIDRADEYILRCALEVTDGLVVHALVGETAGDLPVAADVQVRCYEVLLAKCLPRARALLSIFPFATRHAGPREALLRALASQNYGCSHLVVDPSGQGALPSSLHAQLAITPLFFEQGFHCNGCGGIASIKTCPHDPSARLAFSATRVRELLTRGEGLPAEYARPEVAEILMAAYRAKAA
jgi:ATP sulfurylase